MLVQICALIWDVAATVIRVCYNWNIAAIQMECTWFAQHSVASLC